MTLQEFADEFYSGTGFKMELMLDVFDDNGALYCFRAVNDNTLSCWAAFPDKTKHDNIIASCIENNITPVIVKHINRKTA